MTSLLAAYQLNQPISALTGLLASLQESFVTARAPRLGQQILANQLQRGGLRALNENADIARAETRNIMG